MPPESPPSFPWRLWGAIFRSLQGTESLGPSLEADILRGQRIDVFFLLPPPTQRPAQPVVFLHYFVCMALQYLALGGLDDLYEPFKAGITDSRLSCLVCGRP